MDVGHNFYLLITLENDRIYVTNHCILNFCFKIWIEEFS